jgi:microcompartment protein CcmK/EutM
MKLARVAGTVVSTINVPVFDGRKLLLCDLLGPDGAPAGGYLIAVDTVGAGAGETVLLMDEGNSARQILDAKDAPVRTLVVGIVDAVELAPEASPAEGAAGARRAGSGGPASSAGPAARTRPARRTRGRRTA